MKARQSTVVMYQNNNDVIGNLDEFLETPLAGLFLTRKNGQKVLIVWIECKMKSLFELTSLFIPDILCV